MTETPSLAKLDRCCLFKPESLICCVRVSCVMVSALAEVELCNKLLTSRKEVFALLVSLSTYLIKVTNCTLFEMSQTSSESSL